MDGIEWQRSKWGPTVKRWFRLNEWFGCKFSNHLVADHDEIKRHLVTRHGELSITTIPYGACDITEASAAYLHEFNLQPNEYYLVIARPEPENSILEIVTAFVKSRSAKQLVLLGNYSSTNSYQSQVMKTADSRVVFLGAIYDRAIVSSLRYHCFAYIHGHTVGGTNPSLIEAMGAGCTPIAHDNRFNRGVCGNAAFYFRDMDDLKSIINNVTDESINIIKKDSHTRFIDNYTLELVNKKYMDLFREFSTAVN